jgi:site-specific DNA-methyltransferase (adenine-specific)
VKKEKIGMCEIYHGDCMELMPQYPDKYFDLAIIDPPYGLNIAKNGTVGGENNGVKPKDYGKKDWDSNAPEKQYFDELFRRSKNQIIFGANHFINQIPINSSCWIVWDKVASGNFADCELAWSSFKTAVKKFTYAWNGFRQENMKRKEYRIHPTQKPIALYKWLLSKYADPGQKILDTHLGSGSHAIACYDMGFPLVACEIDEDYYSAAVDRLRTFSKQETLNFDGGGDV